MNDVKDERTKKVADLKSLFNEALKANISEANENITHAEFVTGMQNKTIGFKVMYGEPYQFVIGVRKTIFSIIVAFYTVAPLIIIPLWAYYESNWWLLIGIIISYTASFSAAKQSKIIFLFILFCVGY